MKKPEKPNPLGTYECLKGEWDKPVEAESEQEAREKFECDDCERFPKDCGGVGLSERNLAKLSLDEKTSLVLAELARKPKVIRTGKSKRPFIQKHFGEIDAALAAGNSYKAVAEELRKAGIKISMSSLSHHYAEMKRERAEKR